MKIVFLILFGALPLLAAELPLTVKVSGAFLIDDVEQGYSGTLEKRSSASNRTHFQGTVLFTGFGASALATRMNFITHTSRGKSYAEFVIFRGNTYHQFHFSIPALMPEAGIEVKGIVTSFRERYCTQVWETVCYEELGKGPANITVSY